MTTCFILILRNLEMSWRKTEKKYWDPQKALQRQRGKRYMYVPWRISSRALTQSEISVLNHCQCYLCVAFFYGQIILLLRNSLDKKNVQIHAAQVIILRIYFLWQKKKSSKRKKRRVSYCCWKCIYLCWGIGSVRAKELKSWPLIPNHYF